MAYEGSQGINFTFPIQTVTGYTVSPATFTCTSIQLTKNVSEIDASSLATKLGGFRTYRPAPIRDGDELQIEFIGLSLPIQTATGSIGWAIDAGGSNAGFTAGIPTAALCTSVNITAAVGELIRGTATFRLTQE